ncbi:protein-export chaperone SecB [Bacteroides neonati]|uniref:protein-export chaperone SecB n=1 Tax=Bacteroides neonati TaxID=1347393 RepID=UPI0004B2BEDB|nr:protein-export chaperone SecB [Bacteroides neonati]
MEKVNNSEFRFDGYLIKESSIKINKEVNDSTELGISIIPSGVRYKEKFVLTLEVSIKDRTGDFCVDLTVDGSFIFKEDLENNKLGIFFTANAPALIFPYIRAYVCMLTSLSGAGSVVLPTLNLVDVGRELATKINNQVE